MVESWKSITKSNVKEIVKSWRERNLMVHKEKLKELIAWAPAHCFYEFRIFSYFYKKIKSNQLCVGFSGENETSWILQYYY
jgi:hypothetical protein